MRTKSLTISTTIIGLLCICAIGICTGINNTSALTYQTKINNNFTINPSVSISLSSSELKIEDLTPGSASDSNTIRLTVETNNNYGYTISSTAGDGSTYTDTTLKHKDDSVSDSFTSLATNASIAASEGDNKAGNITSGYWGYSYNLNNTTWSNYSGLPYFNSGSAAELYSTDTNASSTIDFKIAANAKDTQMAGEYNNVVNFITTVNPKPLPYIQDYNSTICSAEANDSSATVVDRRDGSNYTVRYINGTCWMTQNLRITGTIPAAYSNFSGNDINISQDDLDQLVGNCDGEGCNSNDKPMTHNSGNEVNGVWYNYAAATAGTIVGSSNTDEAEQDICPSNWRLPTNIEYVNIKELITSQNIFNPIYGGYYRDGIANGDAMGGFWWSSTANGNTSRYRLGYWNGVFDTGNNANRLVGLYVRCVAK